jgi:hypothetical protein
MGYKTDAAKGIGAGWLIVIVVLVLGGLISAGIWALGVATSGVKGQGDAVKINNSAENWTAKQAFFEEKFEAVKAADKKIGLYTKSLAANPTDRTAQTNLDGITSQCINYTAEYNAESRKFLSQDWKSSDLPYQINDVNSSTDCK